RRSTSRIDGQDDHAGVGLADALPGAALDLHRIAPSAALCRRCGKGHFRDGELREVTAHDRLAEAGLELLLLAGDFIHAAGLEVLAAQASADTDREVWAVSALLPGPQGHERRDLLRARSRAVRTFHTGDAR